MWRPIAACAAALLLACSRQQPGEVVGRRFVPAHVEYVTRCESGYGYGYGYTMGGKYGYGMVFMPCATRVPDSVLVRAHWVATVKIGDEFREVRVAHEPTMGDSI
jgi:hypothetical protein